MTLKVADRIEAFIRRGQGSFGELALAAFAYQHERIPAYRSLCEQQRRPQEVTDWREVPPVPALAFKSVALATAPAAEVFRSSGTTGEGRSVHRHAFPGLYRAAVEASFPSACLVHLPRPAPMLSLIPAHRQVPDSSLAFMVDHVLATWGTADSVVACGPRGVEAAAARSWLSARQREGRPALVLVTSLALLQLLDALERYGLRFRMPAGTTLFDTGGMKGRQGEVSREEFLARVGDRLAIPPGCIVREYGMTELTSQCYTRVLSGGNPETFVAPPWVRVRILDPETLAEAPAGTAGLIAVFDLANLGSAVHVLTEDLGIAAAGDGGTDGDAVPGFRLSGRAGGAELRGCSLTVEELARGVNPAPGVGGVAPET